MLKSKMWMAAVTVSAAFAAVDAGARDISLTPLTPAVFQSGRIIAVTHKSSHRPTIRVSGVITTEGVECTALRGDNGRLYTLAGGAGGFKPGDRVRVIGRLAQVSFCMQGTTIEVRRIVAVR